MMFAEQAYNALVVSSSPKFIEAVGPLLAAAKCSPLCVNNIAAARRALLDGRYDFVIINTPLPDDFGTKFAIDVCLGRSIVCLLFVGAERYEEIRSKVIPHGVFILPKPSSAPAISHGLDFMTAARERLRNLEKKTTSIEEKMEEIRIVNRAKWLLIENLQMTEPDAHRYIEKHAMDNCITRREVAESIIHTYS